MLITAKKKVGEEEVSVSANYEMGSNLVDMCDQIGEGAVYDAAKANIVSQVQGVIRRGISAGKSAEEVQALVDGWKPGVKLVIQKDAMQVIKDRIAALPTMEERQAMFAELKLALGVTD